MLWLRLFLSEIISTGRPYHHTPPTISMHLSGSQAFPPHSCYNYYTFNWVHKGLIVFREREGSSYYLHEGTVHSMTPWGSLIFPTRSGEMMETTFIISLQIGRHMWKRRISRFTCVTCLVKLSMLPIKLLERKRWG